MWSSRDDQGHGQSRDNHGRGRSRDNQGHGRSRDNQGHGQSRDNQGHGQGNYGVGLSEKKDSRAFRKLYDDICHTFDSTHKYKALLHEEIRLNKMALEQLLDSDFNGNATIDNSRAEALHRQRNELQVRYNNVEFAWAQSVKQAYQNVCEASQILAKSCEVARGAIIADTSGGPDSVTVELFNRDSLCPPPPRPPPPPPSPPPRPHPHPHPPPPPPPARANTAQDQYAAPRAQGFEKRPYFPSVPTKMRNADDIDSLTLMGEEPPPLKGQFIRQARSAQSLRPNRFTSEASSAPPTRRMSTLDLRSAPPSRVTQSRTPSRVPAWQFSGGADTSTAAFYSPPSQSLISVSDASIASEANNKRMKFTFTSIIERFPTARNENISPDTYGQGLMIASEPAGTLEPGEIEETSLERFHLIENPYHRRPAAQSAPSADSFESHRREQPKPPSK